MVFRRATVVQDDIPVLYAVRLEDHNPAGISLPSPHCHMVLRNHITVVLPVPGDGGSFFGRTTGFLYKKHVVDYPKAHLLREVKFIPNFVASSSILAFRKGDGNCNAKCRFTTGVMEDKKGFQRTGRHAQTGGRGHYHIDVGCRLFAKPESDAITFICAEMHVDQAGRSMFWTEDSLKQACDYYLTDELTGELVSMDSDATEAGQFDGMSINELLNLILAAILGYLDLDSQSVASRV
ncbi:uncharacterized protein LOC129600022 [Paramacrobiotus metropolitanus]|uniref:uncharacterized protein LOC129600022 n=1 Tax=Paramacrobiotus metropolitanus TaxID=2943436 RepID=UPI0024456EF3|nr:uncharacterized protein LOC129600022 [Paramacrobiotus metropolitanus]